METINVKVNGKNIKAEIKPNLLLSTFLRENLNLTGTHIGCDTSQCGACAIHLDGDAVKSCAYLAVKVDGSDIVTIEGIANGDELHPMQQSFHENHGLQCGFCTPGMVMSAIKLVENNPEISEQEIRKGLEGNICRCTGYQNIVKSIKNAATVMGG
jgi:carbon-monoxide dehydrogenase small subunit